MLVDKEQRVVNGKRVMRLYFYDIADGYVLMYDAPVLKSRGVPALDNDEEVPEETEQMSEDLPPEALVQNEELQPIEESLEEEEELKNAL